MGGALDTPAGTAVEKAARQILIVAGLLGAAPPATGDYAADYFGPAFDRPLQNLRDCLANLELERLPEENQKMTENLEYTIEPSFSEGRRQDGFVLYEWGTYEEWSVLAGQNRKSARDHGDTVDELRDKYPTAVVHAGRVDAGNSTAHLPGEEWDDARQMYRDDYLETDLDNSTF
jgi:hypothetical protein